MDLGEIGSGSMVRIALAHDRDKERDLVKAIMNFPVAQIAEKLPSGCTTGGLANSAQAHGVTRS
jgi:hypothetical protein